MISADEIRQVWVRINSEEGYRKTGIFAVFMLGFGEGDRQSRIALWQMKDVNGKLTFMVPSVGMQLDGQEKELPAMYGQVVQDLTGYCDRIRERIKSALNGTRPPFSASYIVTATHVKEILPK